MRSFDSPFFLDYARFSGRLGVDTASAALETHVRTGQSTDTSRLAYLNPVEESDAIYEGLGHLPNGLFAYQADEREFPAEIFFGEWPKAVVLGAVRDEYNCADANSLCQALSGDAMVLDDWASRLSDLDLVFALRKACEFVAVDCLQNQDIEGREAYNKIKYGTVLIHSATAYTKTGIDAPAAVYHSIDAGAK